MASTHSFITGRINCVLVAVEKTSKATAEFEYSRRERQTMMWMQTSVVRGTTTQTRIHAQNMHSVYFRIACSPSDDHLQSIY